MKIKIKVKYKDEITEGTLNTRDTDYIRLRKKYNSTVVRNKKKYTRKQKYKNKDLED